jgi:hypothetical protein
MVVPSFFWRCCCCNNEPTNDYRNIQVCATLVLLTRRANHIGLKWVLLRILLEALQMFSVVFNTTFQ